MRRVNIWAVTPATLTLALSLLVGGIIAGTVPSAAATKKPKESKEQQQENCAIELNVCYKGCGYGGGPGGDLGKGCYRNCDSRYGDCAGAIKKVQTPPKPTAGQRDPPRGGVTDPKSPPKGTGQRAPVGTVGVKQTPPSGPSGPIQKGGGRR